MSNKISEIAFNDLYKNCIYSSIAHAIFVLREPFFSYTQSWDDFNYSFNYGNARGTISFYFDKLTLVGAARDEKSERRRLYPDFNALNFFDDASIFVKEMAEKDALEYLYDEADDIVKPMATTGFWLENETLFSNDTIEDFDIHGGYFVSIITKDLSELREYWIAEYLLNESEVKVIDYIFSCYFSKKQIRKKDVKNVIHKKCDGFAACIESLNEMKIIIE